MERERNYSIIIFIIILILLYCNSKLIKYKLDLLFHLEKGAADQNRTGNLLLHKQTL